MKLKALVVSHHKRFRRDLSQLVELVDCCIDVVGEGATAREALGQIDLHAPDVVLVDLALRNVSGLELTERIHARWPGIAIVVIGNEPSNDYRMVALDAGAVEYVDVLEVSTQLPEALQRVHCDGNCSDDDSTAEAPQASQEPSSVGVRAQLHAAPTGPLYGPMTAWQYVHAAIALSLVSVALNLQFGHALEAEWVMLITLALLGIFVIEYRQFHRARLAAIASPVRYGRGGVIGNEL